MESLPLTIKQDGRDRISLHLELVNGIFRLTDKERKVLRYFIEEDASGISGNTVRMTVAEELGFKNLNAINNYVKRLKDKGAISGHRTYTYHPVIQWVIEHRSSHKTQIQLNII